MHKLSLLRNNNGAVLVRSVHVFHLSMTRLVRCMICTIFPSL